MRYIIIGIFFLAAPFCVLGAEETITIRSLWPAPGGAINTTENANLAVGDDTKKVGIGTNTPQSKLDVEGGVAIGDSYAGSNAAPDNGLIVEGRVGIGTPSPDSRLVVGGSSTSSNNIGFGGGAYANVGNRYSSGYLVLGDNVKPAADPTDGMVNVNTHSLYAGSAIVVKGNTGIEFHTRSGAATAGAAYSSVRAVIDENGNVGIGTAAPSQRLHVSNGNLLVNDNVGAGDQNSGLRIVSNIATTHFNWRIGAQALINGGLEFTPSTTVGGVNFTTPTMVLLNNGNAGIGTTAPEFKLTLDNDGGILARGSFGSGSSLTTSGAGTRLIWYPRKAAFRAGVANGDEWDDANIGDYSIAMGDGAKASGGNAVAMGNKALAQGFASTAMGNLTNATGNVSFAMGETTTASGFISTAMGKITTASGLISTAMGSLTIASGASSTAMGNGTDATGDYSTAMGKDTIASGTPSIAMGMNTTASGENSTAMGYYTTASGRQSTAMGNTITVSGIGSVGIGLGAGGDTVTTDGVMAIMGGDVGIGQVTPTAKLHVNGNIKVMTLPNLNGADMQCIPGTGAIGIDLAELIETNEEVEPGDVLVIAENGKFEKSSQTYDSKVAGIVSAAPAILFEGSQLQIAPQPFEFKKGNKPPLALAGRVKCKVTADEGGAIKTGDLLVTSSKPGYAMKADADKLRIGHVLGKALESLDKGEGKITILVALQ